MKNKGVLIWVVVVFMIVATFVYIESRPFSVVSSSVIQTGDQTQIQMYVLMNTMFAIDDNEIWEEVVCEHQMVNGVRENTVYTLRLYRTSFHYRRNWEYDTIIYDENGAIICCKDDLGV